MPTENLLQETQTSLRYFCRFLLNPITQIKYLPSVQARSLLVAQALTTLGVTLLGWVFQRSWVTLFFIFLAPFIVLITTLILTFIVLTYFKIIERRDLPPQKVCVLNAVASLPYILGFPFYQYLPPLVLVTCAFSGLTLITGLVENFGVEKKKASTLVGVIVGAFALVWIGLRIGLN